VTARLTSLRSSTAALLTEVQTAGWTGRDVAAPSALPGWTRGHVLSHLARNADAIAGALTAMLRGERIELYPDGRAARDAAIEAGSTRPVSEQLTDLRDAAARLEQVFRAVADAEAWGHSTAQRVARDLPAVRWREVEIHRVDLAHGYRPADWPAEFVAYLLPEAACELAERTSAGLRVTVAPHGSLVSGLVGATWHSGDGPKTEVTGPDWAILAWLVGRPALASDVLTNSPELEPWR
jgi:maleylpyruvate isomerase